MLITAARAPAQAASGPPPAGAAASSSRPHRCGRWRQPGPTRTNTKASALTPASNPLPTGSRTCSRSRPQSPPRGHGGPAREQTVLLFPKSQSPTISSTRRRPVTPGLPWQGHGQPLDVSQRQSRGPDPWGREQGRRGPEHASPEGRNGQGWGRRDGPWRSRHRAALAGRAAPGRHTPADSPKDPHLQDLKPEGDTPSPSLRPTIRAGMLPAPNPAPHPPPPGLRDGTLRRRPPHCADDLGSSTAKGHLSTHPEGSKHGISGAD